MLILLTLLLQSPLPKAPSPAPPTIQGEDEEPKVEVLSPEQWSGDPRFWSVDGDELVGRSTPENPCKRSTFLVHKGTFTDFDLSLEYMVEGGNSGVQFRSAEKGKWNVVGYQADLEDGPNWVGGIYEQGGRGVLTRRSVSLLANGPNSDYDVLADPATMKEIGRGPGWHTYRIRAEGRQIKLWVDGTLTCELDDRTEQAALEGLFALQLHQGPPMTVRYRNIRVLRLPPPDEVHRKWISAAGASGPGTVEVERRLKSTAKLKRARLKAAASGALEFALDGEVFASGKDPFEVELPGPALQKLRDGKPHRLTATCEGLVGPIYLSAVLELEYEDGRKEAVHTDRWWRKAGTKERASVRGSFAAAPWLEEWPDGDAGSPKDGAPQEDAPSVRRPSADR
jgi:hypothetical protein